MALTLPSRALIDALAQRGILAPKANAIRREGTNMNSAHEDVPKFEPPDPGMEPPPLYGRALLDSMPTLGAGFGPSLAMSPAPRRMAPAPSIEDAVRSYRSLEPSGMSMEMAAPPPLPMPEAERPGAFVLPRNYSPSELPEYANRFDTPMARPRDWKWPDVENTPEFVNLETDSVVSDEFGIQELTSSPEYQYIGMIDPGDGKPQLFFAKPLPEESLDDEIRRIITHYDRTGDPKDLNTLGALLKVKEQETKGSRGEITERDRFLQEQLNQRQRNRDETRNKLEELRSEYRQEQLKLRVKEYNLKSKGLAGRNAQTFINNIMNQAEAAQKSGDFDRAQELRDIALEELDSFNSRFVGGGEDEDGGVDAEIPTDDDIAEHYGVPGATVQMVQDIEAELGDDIGDDVVTRELKARVKAANREACGKK